MTCRDKKTRKCKPFGSNFKRLEDVVACYIEKHRSRAEEELRFYAEKPSFREVVNMAAMAIGPWEGIHGHQNVRGVASRLPEFAESLLGALPELEKSASFNELYNAVKARKVDGVGDLTLYDTALRIGAYLKIQPDMVFLHCGAKKGAKNLGIALRGRRSISVDELPSAFRKLKPHEIEDCLCIYQEDLLRFK